ncbi:hypothetical protein [Gymnodinialimonas hymeniacidonis]|uniref:hypothetical protein n=1 Tax=Gymnodinialimonas hymeniacidonis TaxID=3126508 RepID=UPI0034C5E417
MRHLGHVAALAALTALPLPAQAQYEDESVQAFLAADANGDEQLTLNEFRTFIATMAEVGAPMSRRIRNLGAYRIAFGQVDTDGNGLASPAELRAAESANR